MGISFVVLVLGLVVYLIFVAGDRIASQISSSALQVLTKVMGLLLTAIAIQMLINGLVSVFPSLSQAAS